MPVYDDDGQEMNPDLAVLPSLCAICKKRDDPRQERFCNLTRMDQEGEDEFICFEFVSSSDNVSEKDLFARWETLLKENAARKEE